MHPRLGNASLRMQGNKVLLQDYTRLSTDVIKAEGEGLTFREAHLAMEMIADSEKIKAFDISGTPDRSWIDDKGLCNLVGSAFGKRILKL